VQIFSLARFMTTGNFKHGSPEEKAQHLHATTLPRIKMLVCDYSVYYRSIYNARQHQYHVQMSSTQA